MIKTSVEAVVDELDRWSREILVGLKRDGGEALVTELVDATTVEERQKAVSWPGDTSAAGDPTLRATINKNTPTTIAAV